MSALENAIRTARRLHDDTGRYVEIHISHGRVFAYVTDHYGGVFGKGEAEWREDKDGAAEVLDALTKALADQQHRAGRSW